MRVRRQNILSLLLVSGTVLGGITLPPAFAQTEPAPVEARQQAAATLKVAALPVINLSGEKDEKQRRDQIQKAEEELAKQFQKRGFSLIPRDEITAALAQAKIDLGDEEYHNRSSLFEIGQAVGADYVVFVVIVEVDQRRVEPPLGGDEMVGKARTKTWLLKVSDRTAVLSAARHESQARSNLLPSFDSGARLIRNSVAGTVRDVLKPFLSAYPETK